MRNMLDSAMIEGATADAVEARLRSTLDSIASFTIGAEEEYILVDPTTLLPIPRSGEAVWSCHGDRRVAAELLQCQIEGIAPISVAVADVVRELRSVRRLLDSRLAGVARLVAVGAHPTATDPGPITEAPRYAQIALSHPLAARRMLVGGLHVHVAVGGADRALAVFNALRSYLPFIAAVAANAPFHEGEDSGMASVRPTLLRHLPRTGTPPAFRSLSEYAEFLVWSRGVGAQDATHHWWDLRIHPSTGTIEVRVADVPTHVEDTGAIVALTQSLIFRLAERYDSGEMLECHATERIEENARLAARDGVGGLLANLDDGSSVATADAVLSLVEALTPSALALGCLDELSGIERLAREGGGATRQRLVAESGGIDELVRWLAEQTTGRRSGAGFAEPELVAQTG